MTRTLRKADRVSDDLMARIVRRDLKVGSILPKEAELAEEYGVNRGVIREAIKLLEVHRLVQPRRRRGTEVLDPMNSLSPELLRTMLCGAGAGLDLAVLRDLLEIRAAIDVQMCSLAAQRHCDADLAALEACLDQMEASLDDSKAFALAISRLALALAKATQNRIFIMLVHWHEQVRGELAPVIDQVRRPSLPLLQGMRLLVDTVRAGDHEAVARLVQTFHSWATPILLETAARQLQQDPSQESD